MKTLRYSHWQIALVVFMALCFILKVILASYDNFLHDWDERYHALVAKNLINNPFKPMLIAHPIFPYDIEAWCCNHIWLHKPPLALWAIAGSLKVFGLSTLAVRLPSILLSTVLIAVNYHIGLSILSQRLGLLMALISGITYYFIELSLGALRVDHVDTMLIFFASSAFLAYIKLLKDPLAKWMWLAGLATAGAILSKWIIGFIPLLIYFTSLVCSSRVRFSNKHWIAGILSGLIAVAISSPWYIYSFIKFPNEAWYELSYNFRHLTDTLEGNGGNPFSYLTIFHWQYGILAWPLLLLGTYRVYKSQKIINEHKYFISLGLVVTYLFFSLIANTKMPAYVLIASSLVFMILGTGIDFLIPLINRKYVMGLFAVLIGYAFLAPHNLIRVHILNQDTHLIKASEYPIKRHNTSIYKSLKNTLPASTVILNTPSFEDVECMFWSGYSCYHWWPEEGILDSILVQEYNIRAFRDHGEQKLPEYIKNDHRITIIDKQLQ